MAIAKILMVDDDRDLVEIIKQGFETMDYEVRFAYDPDEGFAKLEEETPDLMILDVMMGRGAGGFVLARKIRKDARFNGIPIVMMTGIREQTGFDFPAGDPKHPQFLPVDEFLEKPIHFKDLFGKVQEQLTKVGKT